MVERVVVDTDVISFVFKGHGRAAAYEKVLDGKQIPRRMDRSNGITRVFASRYKQFKGFCRD